MSDLNESRVFKGGSWDLRKTERRLNQITIEFANRRAEDRIHDRRDYFPLFNEDLNTDDSVIVKNSHSEYPQGEPL